MALPKNKPKNSQAPFSSVSQAVKDFEKLQLAYALGFYGVDHRQINFPKEIKNWVGRANHLSWSKDEIIDLISSVSGKRQNILEFLGDPDYSSFTQMMIKQKFDPCWFLPSLQVSPLGHAIYSLNDHALTLFLTLCSPPSSRLVLLPEHISGPGDPRKNRQSYTTVLHRLVERRSGSFSLDDANPVKKIVDLIITHDPDILLQKNSYDELPEDFAHDGLKNYLRDRRQNLQAQRSQKDLLDQIQSEQQPNASPRKM